MNFTPIERRLLAVLSDGQPHRPAELMAAIDAMATVQNVRYHLSVMRRKLRQRGESIDAVYHNRTLHYRHFRLLHAPCRAPSGA